MKIRVATTIVSSTEALVSCHGPAAGSNTLNGPLSLDRERIACDERTMRALAGLMAILTPGRLRVCGAAQRPFARRATPRHRKPESVSRCHENLIFGSRKDRRAE